TPRRLNLIDDPIPVADRLHCHRRASLAPFEKLLQRPPFMRDPLLTNQPTIRSYHRRQRVALVRIEGDILHRLRLLSRLTPPSVAHAHGILTVCGGAALSSHQRDSNPWLSHDHAFAIESADLRASESGKSAQDSNFSLRTLTGCTLSDEAQTRL